jgi:hypothetical protein
MRSYAIRNGVTSEKSQLHSNAMKAIVLAVILDAAFQAEVHARPESSPQIAPIEEILIKDRGPESWLLTFSNSQSLAGVYEKLEKQLLQPFWDRPKRVSVHHSFSNSEVLGL